MSSSVWDRSRALERKLQMRRMQVVNRNIIPPAVKSALAQEKLLLRQTIARNRSIGRAVRIDADVE
jgi:hypothetical protein